MTKKKKTNFLIKACVSSACSQAKVKNNVTAYKCWYRDCWFLCHICRWWHRRDDTKCWMVQLIPLWHIDMLTHLSILLAGLLEHPWYELLLSSLLTPDDLELSEEGSDSRVVAGRDLHPDTTWGPYPGLLQSEGSADDQETEVTALLQWLSSNHWERFCRGYSHIHYMWRGALKLKWHKLQNPM